MPDEIKTVPPVLDFTEPVGLDAVLNRLDQIRTQLESLQRELATNEREYGELMTRERRLVDEYGRLREKVALLANVKLNEQPD